MGWTCLVAAGALLVVLATGTATPAGAGVDVNPDPKDAAFVGTGGLLLPGDSFTGTPEERHAVAACADCTWAVVPVCKGSKQGVGCGRGATSCVVGRRMVILLQRPPSLAWDNVGSFCSTGAPVTVASLAQRLHDVVIRRVPALHPTSQPPGGTVVNLPTLFASNQPRTMGTRHFTVVGFQVELNARASWRWSFGDGSILDTTSPGGGWPDRSVSHVFRRAGAASVRVTSEWRGWFTVDGIGPFSVQGPGVTQSSALVLPVHEARAMLVNP